MGLNEQLGVIFTMLSLMIWLLLFDNISNYLLIKLFILIHQWRICYASFHNHINLSIG